MFNMLPPTDEELLQTGTGALSGAATGAAIGAAGGPIGAGAGALIGAGLSYFSARLGTQARKKAEKEAEKARTTAIVREQGIKSQAESLVAGNLMRSQRGSSRQMGTSTTGFIGQNLPTQSGTF
jgi:hypothetical protein